MGAKAAEAYCQRLQPTFSDLEMSEIRTALNHRISARYEKYHHQLSGVGSKG